MDKKTFLDALCRELKKLGADDAAAAAQRDKMDSYLRSKNMETVDVDPTRMAEGIMQKLKAEGHSPAEQTTDNDSPAGTSAKTGANGTEDPLSALGTKPHRPMTVAHEVFGEEPAKVTEAPQKNEGVVTAAPPSHASAPKAERQDVRHPQSGQQKTQAVTEVKRAAAVKAHAEDPMTDPMTDPNYYQSRKQKKNAPTASLKEENKTLFWILFCIAVPLGAILCIAAAVAFLGLIALLAAVAIGFVAALIAVVAAGCSIALIGIIYGLYKIVSGAVPIGLYEVGLGITTGSVASFIGILMYNIAIRLVPFLMKKLAELVSFGFRKAKDGFVALKGALEDQ